jgi:hypothetical protein
MVFQVGKGEAGRRYVRQFRVGFLTITCPDASTHSSAYGYKFFSPSTRIAEGGTFHYEDGLPFEAFRLEGRLGHLHGEGALSYTRAALTEDGQAQVCTSGDLSWTVEYIRTIITKHRF